MPRGNQIFFGYMRDAQRRIDASANVHVPGSAWFHFAFVLYDSTRVGLYINGVKELSGRLDTPLFNPEPVEYRRHFCSRSLFTFTATETHYSWTDKIQQQHDCSVERETQERQGFRPRPYRCESHLLSLKSKIELTILQAEITVESKWMG